MSSWGLFYILRWVLRTVKSDFDRTRLLEKELTDLDSVCRLSFNLPPKGPPRRTRSERREELEEELRNIGKNNDST
jgi:hypothetical protein